MDPATERFLLRGVAHGDADAVAGLFDLHGARIFGILRMALPTADEAEEALWETFAVAADRAAQLGVREDAQPWLIAIAVERVTARSRPTPPVSLDEVRKRRATEAVSDPAGVPESHRAPDSSALLGVNDTALATLVRTLDFRSRQALVMRHLCDLGDAEAAAAVGCAPEEIAGLVDHAIAGLEERLGDHCDREEELRRQLSDANPYKLRPIDGLGPIGGARADFDTEVRGASVFATRTQQPSLLSAFRNAVRAVLEAFRQRHDADDVDDDVGDVKSPGSPAPTPTQRQLEKPKRTPSLTDYRTPKLSPGVAVYAMPRSTPATERISSPRRPVPAAGWATAGTRGNRR